MASEVVTDVNLRNTIGCVAYAIADGAIWVPTPQGRHVRSVDMLGLPVTCYRHGGRGVEDIHKGIQPMVQGIAQATAIRINHNTLPELPDDVDEGDSYNWQWARLPCEPMWLEVANLTHEDSQLQEAFFIAQLPPVLRTDDLREVFADEDIVYLVQTFAVLKDKRVGRIEGMRPWKHAVMMNMTIFFGRSSIRNRLAYGAINNMFSQAAAKASKKIQRERPDFRAALVHNDPFTHEIMVRHNTIIRTLYTMNMISNVVLVHVAPSNFVPKYARKWPRLTYHVLKINRRSNVVSPKLEEQHRQSPRQHLRRGHLRRLNSKTSSKPYTWVMPCIVGSSEKGHVVKDYIL